jgi:hypothetical protein
MENIKDSSFQLDVKNLLAQQKEILVLIYYNLGAGSRDFLFIRNEEKLKEIINSLKPSDELTIFKSFHLLYRGLSKDDLRENLKTIIEKEKKGDWLVIWETLEENKIPDWNFFDNFDDLKEELKDTLGKKVTILCEPDWQNEEEIIRGYYPKENGKVEIGKY